MRRVVLLAAAISGLVVIPGAGIGVAQKPPKPPKPAPTPSPYQPVPTLSLAAAPNPVTFPAPVRLSGTLRSRQRGVRITVLAQAARTASFRAVGTATTGNNGRWSLNHRPTVNTKYRATGATVPAVQSGDLLVRVRMLVGLRVSDPTPSRGEAVRFFGIVRPPHNARRASIQRRAPSGRWVTLARPRLRRLDAQTSRYSRRLRVRSTGTYRARVLGHDDHAQGISRARRLTVD